MRASVIALLLVLATVSTIFTGIVMGAATNGTAPRPAEWGAVAVAQNVSIGAPMQLIVFGPANASFTVAANEQPFNGSGAVFTTPFQLPPGANRTGRGSTTLNLSVPTKELDYGPVQLRLSNESVGSFAWLQFDVVGAVNTSAMWAQLQSIWAQLNITDERQQGLLYGQAQQTTYYQVAVVLNVLVWVSVVAIVLLSSSPLKDRKLGKRVRAMVHSMLYSQGYVGPDPGMSPAERIPDPQLGAVYFSRFFRDCKWRMCDVRQTQQDIISHLRAEHKIPQPMLGHHYEMDYKEAARTARLRERPRLDLAKVDRLMREKGVDGPGFNDSAGRREN